MLIQQYEIQHLISGKMIANYYARNRETPLQSVNIYDAMVKETFAIGRSLANIYILGHSVTVESARRMKVMP